MAVHLRLLRFIRKKKDDDATTISNRDVYHPFCACEDDQNSVKEEENQAWDCMLWLEGTMTDCIIDFPIVCGYFRIFITIENDIFKIARGKEENWAAFLWSYNVLQRFYINLGASLSLFLIAFRFGRACLTAPLNPIYGFFFYLEWLFAKLLKNCG